MSDLTYTTAGGITVTRVASGIPFKKGLGSLLRALIEEFRDKSDARLALVGAFGYDLLFQFDPIELKLPREGHKDLRLFLCDDIYYMDRKKEQIERFRYDFEHGGLSTAGLARSGEPIRKPKKRKASRIASDHTP